MVHPDYQYTSLVTALASMIAYDVYDVVLGSRIIGGGSLKGGMPSDKYASNRLLTAFENLMLRAKLSEYHKGYRAFSRDVLIHYPCWKIRMTLSSIARCWRNAYTLASVLAKFPALRNISRKRRRSVSEGV